MSRENENLAHNSLILRSSSLISDRRTHTLRELTRQKSRPKDMDVDRDCAKKPNERRNGKCNALPFEILTHIFDLAVDKESRTSIRTPPMNISQTCRAWRACVISNPKYWNNFTTTDKDRRINRNMWLDRSQETLLTCKVIFHDKERRGRLRTFLHILGSFQRRWESISIKFWIED